jgi:addiction module HigA family antidote
MAVEVHSSFVIHPGTWLKEAVVAPTGLSVRALAEKLDVSRPTLSRLLNGHAGLSSEMALRFEKAFGLNADTLMRMQIAHEMTEARERLDELRVDRVLEAA